MKHFFRLLHRVTVLMRDMVASEPLEFKNLSRLRLIERIRELEARIASIKPEYLSSSQARTLLSLSNHTSISEGLPVSDAQTSRVLHHIKTPKIMRHFDFSAYNHTRIALKFAYLGSNYNGLVTQKDTTPLPTVEEKIIAALLHTRLISSFESCDFARCGRTDKGVSAFGQVMSLLVRDIGSGGDYVGLLNKVLPDDIRILAQARVDDSFSARFSCTGRWYKYFFHARNLDISRMKKAASYFLGENDFKNFCKVDNTKKISTYKRLIRRAEIDEDEDGIWVFNLEGSAFLWHQVRCMMAILFRVGQGIEEPEIVLKLMDTENVSVRPNYPYAWDTPLVLYDTSFDGVQWVYPDTMSETGIFVKDKIWQGWHEAKIKERLWNLLKGVADVQEDQWVKKGVYDGRGKIQPVKNYKTLVP
ncbi:tRNA pseudouridine(38/39) synthase [Neolecta irregularis DAH-3]|uniref:tRNA pseudouridine synthase n=1 Tax=Neolecta irregularis (strain DAH-3) TaxID=1198029 RepID=A0A1U7LPG1_NEOID|nr:tRNA pseudouridine(38/39) synthase [Neolecta irregularis DAH-3]|eukprot:OLL24432.1 tRNA pseudouridine(38/39) synthase [Neolecta irregularis DAH-3]